MAWELFVVRAEQCRVMMMVVIMPVCICWCCCWCLIWHLASQNMNFLQDERSTCWQAWFKTHTQKKWKKKETQSKLSFMPRFIFYIIQWDLSKCSHFYDYCYVLLKSQCAIDFIVVATDAIVDNDDGCCYVFGIFFSLTHCLFVCLLSFFRVFFHVTAFQML